MRYVLQDVLYLFDSNSRKPLDELCNRGAAFQVLKQRGHGHARAAKYPSAAVNASTGFNGRACGPIDHSEILALSSCSSRTGGSDAQRHNQRRAREVGPKKRKPTFARPLHLKFCTCQRVLIEFSACASKMNPCEELRRNYRDESACRGYAGSCEKGLFARFEA